MARTARVLTWAGGIVLLTLLLLMAVGYFLLQSRPGQEFVLRAVLGQSDRFLQGELQVDGIRSDGLLRGFTLSGVAIRDERGRPFLEADSLRVRYGLRGLLRRELVLAPAEVWAPRLVLETLHGDGESNLARIFLQGERDATDEEEPAESAFSFAMEEFTVHDGTVLIRVPVDELPPARLRSEEVEGYPGIYQRIEFRDLNLKLESADLLSPDRDGERLRLSEGSLVGHVFEEPFVVEDLRGRVERSGARLAVDLDRFWLTGSELSGLLVLDWTDADAGIQLELGLEADPVRLEDFRWLEPRLPTGGGRLTLQAEGPLTSGEFRVSAMDLEVEGSRVRGDVGFRLGDDFRFTESDLQVSPLQLALLEPWLPEPLPVQGRISGTARFSGPLANLRVDGRVAYDDPEAGVPTSTVEARGILHMDDDPGVTNMVLAVDPLRFGTLSAFLPDFPVQGDGSFRAELSGRFASGLRVAADLQHQVASADGEEPLSSRVTALGSVHQIGGDLRLAMDLTLSPLSMDGVAQALGREIPAKGNLAGALRVEGPLNDLIVEGRLDTPGGAVNADLRVDALDPLRAYRGSLSVADFQVEQVTSRVPASTRVSGTLFLDGRGGTPETLEGEFRLSLRDARSGEVVVDRFELDVEARNGTLFLSTLEMDSPLGVARGSGSLGLRDDAPSGRMEVSWEAPDLARLRPVIFGHEEAIVPDTLTPLDREVLRMQGIDPDTLVADPAVALEGAARGEFTLAGRVEELTATGWVELTDAVYGEGELASGRVDFVGSWRGRDEWHAEGVLDLDQFGWDRWTFLRASGEVAYRPGEGEIRMDFLRAERESYRLRAQVGLDSAQTTVELNVLELNLDDVLWSLEHPTRIVYAEGGRLTVDPFRVSRPGVAAGDEVRMEASGVLDLNGESNFRVETVGVEMERLGRVLQLEEFPEGILDLDVRFQGAADSPVADATFLVREFVLGGTSLSRVSGTAQYEGLELTAGVEAHLEGRRLFTLDGAIPMDLALQGAGPRLPDEPMDLHIRLNDFPAATAVGFLDVLEEVEGTLDGDILLRGSPRNLIPSGELQLTNGAMAIPDQGVRIGGIYAEMSLRDDQTLEIRADARSRGTARVTGTVGLADPINPTFDLQIVASGFQAVDRRDLSARVGGEVTLTGPYDRPRIGGSVRVEQGAIYLEEFARTAEVIDLTDPALFDVVDTTLVAVRPVVEAAQNPFIQNLRVDVDLGIQRDFWLRSREMNVELGGNLIVTFDRRDREILLVGGLQAIRGSYTAFGRQFQVEGGRVEFPGTPGINPALDIQAVNRLRREGGEPLDIIASVEGTLLNLTISLSSDSQPPIAESDLISYLIFGRPSYALASGESSILQGAAGAGVSAGIGTLATQLGSVVAQQFGVDYFTITQTREGAGIESAPGFAGTFADTQIELGQYIGNDLFLAIVLRPLTGLGGGARTQFPGARLEWRFTDTWTLEAFVEDRFAREGASGFGELGMRLSKVLGLSIYREWGY